MTAASARSAPTCQASSLQIIGMECGRRGIIKRRGGGQRGHAAGMENWTHVGYFSFAILLSTLIIQAKKSGWVICQISAIVTSPTFCLLYSHLFAHLEAASRGKLVPSRRGSGRDGAGERWRRGEQGPLGEV